MRPDDLVGYGFNAATYCADHILAALDAEPIGLDSVELELERLADERGIDRDDEASFDSGEFPKVELRGNTIPYGGPQEDESTRCDNCGAVLADQPAIPWRAAADQRRELQGIVNGYAECALWSSNDPDKETPLDDKYSVGDIDAATMRDMRRDCAVFVKANRDELERFSTLTGRGLGSIGHDLWLTRNHHGAGFWDRYMEADLKDRKETEKLGERLTLAAQELGEYDLMPDGEQVSKM